MDTLATAALSASLLALLAPTPGAQVTLPVSPKACYLHVSANDAAESPLIVSLASIGVAAGDWLRIRTLGDIDNGPSADTINSSIGVFSADATILGEGLLQRVPGAISAGLVFVSAPTLSGGEPTDFPEDFRITSALQAQVVVAVPAGAQFLFVGNHDSQWFDNSDPDGDFRVELTEVGCWSDVGPALAGSNGLPQLAGSGLLLGAEPVTLDLTSARASSLAALFVGGSLALAPFKGGVLVPSPDLVLLGFSTNASGEIHLASTWPSGVPGGFVLVWQFWIADPAGPHGAASSQGLQSVTP